MAEDRRLLRRVVLRNYKSIAACDVSPAQLTFLVGPNGSGKSNFLDALRFVSDSLRHSLDHALRDRGGINEVRRRSSGHPTHFGMRVEFDLGMATGHFAFTVAAKQGGGYGLKARGVRGSAEGRRPSALLPGVLREDQEQRSDLPRGFAPSPRTCERFGTACVPSGLRRILAIRVLQPEPRRYPDNAVARPRRPHESRWQQCRKRAGPNRAAVSRSEEDDRGVPGEGSSRHHRSGPEVRWPCRDPGVQAACHRGAASMALLCQQHVRRHAADSRLACGAIPDEWQWQRRTVACRSRGTGGGASTRPRRGFLWTPWATQQK